jgi:hypothetical protein
VERRCLFSFASHGRRRWGGRAVVADLLRQRMTRARRLTRSHLLRHPWRRRGAEVDNSLLCHPSARMAEPLSASSFGREPTATSVGAECGPDTN